MGFPINTLPDSFLRRIPKGQRAPMGKAGVTNAEANAAHARREEKKLQNLMVQELNRRNIFFLRSRMDKPTTLRKGMPDFVIILPGPRPLLVEAKDPHGVISDEQKKLFDQYFDQTRDVVHIVFSFEQFRALLLKHLPE